MIPRRHRGKSHKCLVYISEKSLSLFFCFPSHEVDRNGILNVDVDAIRNTAMRNAGQYRFGKIALRIEQGQPLVICHVLRNHVLKKSGLAVLGGAGNIDMPESGCRRNFEFSGSFVIGVVISNERFWYHLFSKCGARPIGSEAGLEFHWTDTPV